MRRSRLRPLLATTLLAACTTLKPDADPPRPADVVEVTTADVSAIDVTVDITDASSADVPDARDVTADVVSDIALDTASDSPADVRRDVMVDAPMDALPDAPTDALTDALPDVSVDTIADVACPTGQTRCSGACVDLASDANNCGACSRRCPAWQVCDARACVRDVVRLAAGAVHTCALRRSGAVACWGANDDGELGDRTRSPRTTPVAVVDLTDAVRVTAGSGYTCALRATGEVRCWGDNTFGQLGDGTTTDRTAPTRIDALTDVTDVTAGGIRFGTASSHTCALLRGGAVRCWGGNYDGQLGDGTNVTPRSNPVAVVGLTAAAIGSGVAGPLAVGGRHSCAINAAGGLSCWGINSSGQLGNAGTASSNVPTSVSSLADPVQVSLGFFHGCALRSGGSVVCWGSSSVGQVGDGTNTTRRTPVAVVGLPSSSSVVQVAVGGNASCARSSDGNLYCWGSNPSGDRSTAMPMLTGAVDVALGELHACALRDSGEVVCWGRNDVGQIGDGSRTDRATPTTVMALP